MTVTEGSFLNEKAKKQGWIVTDPTQHACFVFADGTTKRLTEKNLLKHVTGRAQADDAHVQALLDLRYDPECAIYTAVDYAKQNTSALQQLGYPLDSLASTDRAKLMYASHNLGPGDVAAFVGETIAEAHAKVLLNAQVGAAAAAALAKEHEESYVSAHRQWLNDFIEQKITPQAFACDPSSVPVGRCLLEITAALKGGKS